ncbi:methyl-accepting chemotaxis protein signaling domain protein [Bacteriovorax sp. BSW11_IV]|uniref:methyl-accepting chemotaxis protein n=1 Tax=Bacteriovorax sp. BSW11_IV TaxID=1353529 RepID=UPI00038A21CE|nr:methyl-accepting chemotaxis protein [Bacteriovorax sp. BSW11_IV]EQC48298.1 methyl-accepting chemotaxis protein signaling domain protein [Bacteriovorax sp. BSW11_IV]
MSLQFKILTALIIIFSSLTASVLYTNYSAEKAFVEEVIEAQTHSLSEQYFDSVNTLMITGSMEEREILRKKFLSKEEILEARIIRGDLVKADFGEGFPHESAANEIEKEALKGTSHSSIALNNEGVRVVSVITPFKAYSNYKGTNCLECHVSAKEGDVLGAVKITYDLTQIDKKIIQNTTFTAKLMGAMFLVALLAIGFILHILIVKRVVNLKNIVEEIGTNLDLTKRTKKSFFKDEISALSLGLNTMLERFHHSIKVVSEKTENVLHGSKEVESLSNETLANSSVQQDEINLVAQAITEMAQTSKQVVDHSALAKEATKRANDNVQEGSNNAQSAKENIESLTKSIEDVAGKMNELEKEGKEIISVLTMINDITMKTQHLSINAAVEATRAGVHGKGFIVVAEEIGELASETKSSTQKIQNITSRIQELISETASTAHETKDLALKGNQKVSDTFNSFQNIAEEMNKASMLSNDIYIATTEQSSVADSIHQNIVQIMDITSKATASSKSLSTLSNNFEKLARELKNLIQKFKS